MTTNNIPVKNTDRELWRESDDRSQCTPSIHVTQDGHIGINVGGTVIVRTLREWHAMANAPRCSDAPSREWISKMADGEDRCASVSARNPDAIEPKQDASGVERYKVPDDYVGVVRHKGYGHVEVVKAADHDRVVAEKDATIAELRAEVKRLEGDYDSQLDDWRKERTRAEAAEAKCAHWYDELTRIAHHFRVSIDPDDTQKLNPEGTAKLAASFRTRAEAAEAKCAELESLAKCRGCGKILRIENSWMCDGCPCNNPRGINHGIVSKECCTCDSCEAETKESKLRKIRAMAEKELHLIETELGAKVASLAAQLTAANERVREAYAILCQREGSDDVV